MASAKSAKSVPAGAESAKSSIARNFGGSGLKNNGHVNSDFSRLNVVIISEVEKD